MEKIIKTLTLATILWVIGICLTFLLYQEVHPTSIQEYQTYSTYRLYKKGPLVQGDRIQGEIQATEDNLGTVKLRIHTFNRQNRNTIRFRLRQKGTTEWAVQNDYVVDRFVNGLLYPFGFLAIKNAKGNTYEFEVESLNGTGEDAIGIGNGFQDTAAVYSFSRESILRNAQAFQRFLTRKVSSLFSDPHYLLFSIIFLFPGFLYAFHSARPTVRKAVWMPCIAILVQYGLVSYIPIAVHPNTIACISVLVLAELLVFYRRFLLPNFLFTVSLLFLFQMVVTLFLGMELPANKLAASLFYLILISLYSSYRQLDK